ncbi:NADH-quinone oxidoreductase subunit N [Methylacidiphilum caldifontis]|uniref:NADH-quinone oxidoreductase subunit N n=1 Tax=Methylacidiphilum caldifontis TaxID=2795386 RepID=A0A4Y8PCW2_9BACT|nr:NADH-quinone oxidoreductase subunit N [Methylacidiphilum caldifontis]TFE68939.1 NADH-quinone oxidoreductase subunit N [Methylacidiphilum caldifontis]
MNTFFILCSPEFFLTVSALVLLLWQAFAKLNYKSVGVLVLADYLAAGVLLLPFVENQGIFYNGLYVWDKMAVLWKVFFLITGFLVSYISLESDSLIPKARAEFYILPLLTTAGMALLASVRDFILLFVGLEIVTVSFYVFVAFQREFPSALEAGMKYLIIGALASSFLVMGIAFVFGITGSTQFDEVARFAQKSPVNAPLILGLVFILVGLGFKASAVPFHVWTPDVYQGASTPITTFLAVGSKAAGFVVLLRILNLPFYDPGFQKHWIPLIVLMALLSVVFGNLAAIPQRNIKRMLGYSSISHGGFLLMGLSAHNKIGCAAVIYYFFAYLVAIFAAFLVIVLLEKNQPSGVSIKDFNGLYQKNSLMAWSMAFAMISLAGLPPLMGFFGKLMVFLAAWESGQHLLVIVGAICAAAGLYYYIGVVRAMFWTEPENVQRIDLSPATKVLLWILSIGSILLGFYAEPVIKLVGAVLS